MPHRLPGGNAPGASEALIGSPRSGKSVTLKTLALTWLAHNHAVIVVDPKAEYGPLAQWAGGEVVPSPAPAGPDLTCFISSGWTEETPGRAIWRRTRSPTILVHC